eukprot:3144378-Amphidinium_carterae.1
MSILTPDMSTCAQGCPSGQSVDVSVTGGSFNVALTTQVSSGSATYVDCSSGLSSSYSGSLAISCLEGNVTVEHNCSFACAAGKSTTVALDGADYDVIVTAELGHGLQENLTCAEVAPAYNYDGYVLIDCTDGEVGLVASTCSPQNCSTADHASFSLGGSQ